MTFFKFAFPLLQFTLTLFQLAFTFLPFLSLALLLFKFALTLFQLAFTFALFLKFTFTFD